MIKGKKYDLKDRFIDFAVRIIQVTDAFPNTATGKHIGHQLLKCGTSSAANYGESQSAESKLDFIHKLKLSLKELRETEIWLKIVSRTILIQPVNKLQPLLQETDELISIVFKSIDTAKKNIKSQKN